MGTGPTTSFPAQERCNPERGPREIAGAARNILVIDDDPGIRELLAVTLAREGFAVRTAENGRVGLRLFADLPPDLVISDIVMPDVEGIEVLLAVKASATAPKVIAISGGGRLPGHDFLTWAAHLGADAVMPKPFRVSTMVARVQELLRA